MTKPALYTTKQVSEMLDIPVRTLEDWRYRKVGPTWIRVGASVRGAVRYSEEAIREYIEQSTHRSVAP